MASMDIYLNIPRLYTALAEWLSVIIFINFIPKRYSKKVNIGIVTLFLFILTGFHLWADTWNINFWILGMILVVLIMFTFINLVAKVNISVTIHLTVFAFILSEFIASLEWQIEYYLITSSNDGYQFMKNISHNLFGQYHLRISLLLIITYIIFYIVGNQLEKRYQKKRNIYSVRRADVFSMLVLGILIFAISNFSFLNINSPISSNKPLEMFYIRTLVDLLGVIILYSHREHIFATQKNLEVTSMNNLLDRQYEQYKNTMRTIDIINQKYHDIKHHINVIRHETDEELKHEYLDLLEDKIKPYEMIFQTGNNVLDIILNSKGDIMLEKKIQFTCIADGKLLDFISSIDLVSIFSNALDNAIESLAHVDEEKKIIKLHIFSHSNLLMIKIENYYQTPLHFYNGQLQTTKENKEQHGFGLKSIKSAVHKYGGGLNINTDDNWFTILILIPMVKN